MRCIFHIHLYLECNSGYSAGLGVSGSPLQTVCIKVGFQSRQQYKIQSVFKLRIQSLMPFLTHFQGVSASESENWGLVGKYTVHAVFKEVTEVQRAVA